MIVSVIVVATEAPGLVQRTAVTLPVPVREQTALDDGVPEDRFGSAGFGKIVMLGTLV